MIGLFYNLKRLLALGSIAKHRAFKAQYVAFARKAVELDDVRFTMEWRKKMPIFGENTTTSSFDTHYVYHTAWAARLLAANKPIEHHDFASDIRFATIASAFVKINFYDFRPLAVHLSGLRCMQADVTKTEIKEGSIESLSCMHVVEHIGLGRYGDQIDPFGDLKAIQELKRILAKGGNLYFVVPIGLPVIRFNAHRIYSYDMIVKLFKEYSLQNFSLVTDEGRFLDSPTVTDSDKQIYGCGCFWFQK